MEQLRVSNLTQVITFLESVQWKHPELAPTVKRTLNKCKLIVAVDLLKEVHKHMEGDIYTGLPSVSLAKNMDSIVDNVLLTFQETSLANPSIKREQLKVLERDVDILTNALNCPMPTIDSDSIG